MCVRVYDFLTYKVHQISRKTITMRRRHLFSIFEPVADGLFDLWSLILSCELSGLEFRSLERFLSLRDLVLSLEWLRCFDRLYLPSRELLLECECLLSQLLDAHSTVIQT